MASLTSSAARRSLATMAAMVLVLSACTSTTEIAAEDLSDAAAAGTVEGADPGTGGTSEAGGSTDARSADSPEDGIPDDASTEDGSPDGATDAVEDDALAVPTAAPSAARVVPPGWNDSDLGSYRVAVPGNWTTITSLDEIDNMLEGAADQTDIPRAALQQYRAVLEGGDAIVALAGNGDNLNAFRQRGNVAMLGDPDALASELEAQFATFAQNVSIEATPRFFGDQPGVVTTGQYDLNGQRFRLYQFGTAHGDHLYYFTVTLLSGPDQALADQVFNSIGFD